MARQRRWLSDNEEKASAEAFFLGWTPVWAGVVAAVVLTGAVDRMGDVSLMALGLGLMLPIWVVPLFRSRNPLNGIPFQKRYAFKFNVWIAIVAGIASYFYTHFFFDILGMRYAFPATWHAESTLMDRSGRPVPLFLYPLAHVYFATYFTVIAVGVRRLSRAFGARPWVILPAILVLSYVVAFAETFAMATGALSAHFHYVDRGRMLWLGSAAYALVLAVSFPFVNRIDERPDDRRLLGRVFVDAFAAGMLALIVLDLWAAVVGAVYR